MCAKTSDLVFWANIGVTFCDAALHRNNIYVLEILTITSGGSQSMMANSGDRLREYLDPIQISDSSHSDGKGVASGDSTSGCPGGMSSEFQSGVVTCI